MNRYLGLLLIMTCLSIPTYATLPSDLIKTAPLPGTISLSGTTADSARAIDGLNEPLQKWKAWEVADIGHYASYTVKIDQDAEAPAGVPGKLLNFSQTVPEIPASIGNATENTVVINSTSRLYL